MNIKLPRCLSYKISSNKGLKKAMSIYLYLVALKSQGSIKMNPKLLNQAAAILRVTTRTILTWIKLAEQNGLIVKEGSDITPISFKRMKEIFEVTHTGYYLIKVGKVKIEYILDLKCMEEQHLRCRSAYERKKKKIEIDNGLGIIISKFGLSESNKDIINIQRYDYLTGQSKLELTNIERLKLNAINPDFETGVKKYHKIFGYKSSSGFCYKKQKLREMGMIEVEKRQFIVPIDNMPLMTTQIKRYTKLGSLKYFKKEGTLNLFLTDKISFKDANNWNESKTNKKNSNEKI